MGLFKREKIEISKRINKYNSYRCRLCNHVFNVDIPIDDENFLSDRITYHQCGRGMTGLADILGQITEYSDTEKEFI